MGALGIRYMGCFRNKVYGTFILGIIPASSQWLPVRCMCMQKVEAFKNDLFSTTITAFANHGLSQGSIFLSV